MFLREFGTGIRSYGEAIVFIISKKLWWFFLFPLAINLLLLAGGLGIINNLSAMAETWLIKKLGVADDEFFMAEYIGGFISALVWLGLKVLFFFVLAYISGYVLLMLMSPFFSLISARVEKLLTGKDSPFSPSQLFRDVIRGSSIAIRNMAFQSAIIVLLFFIGFLPIIGWFNTVLLFVVSAYFYGFSFIDYTLESKKLSVHDSLRFSRRHKGLLISNGSVFSAVLLIPFIGVLIAPYVAVISVVAATLSVNHPSVDDAKNEATNE